MRVLAEIMWMLIVWSPLDPSVKTVQDCYEKPGMCEGKETAVFQDRSQCIKTGMTGPWKAWSCEAVQQKFAGEPQ